MRRCPLFVLAALLLPLAAACTQAHRTAAPPTHPASNLAENPASPLFRFAIYGDTRDNHPIHRDIVKAVLSFQPALVLQTGDLVHHGDVAAEWAVFDEITGEMRKQIPYYPARGNHDIGGFFEKHVTEPVLSGNKLYYSFEKGNVHFVALDTEQDLKPHSKQGDWLETDLAQAQAAKKFIIPFFHKAIFSVGFHAKDGDVLALRPILHTLFQKYGVRLVFEGHDHIYYRTVRNGITYIVTGGGGAPFHPYQYLNLEQPKDVFEEVNHFCLADVYPDSVKVTAYRRDLTLLDQMTVKIDGV
jgi:3',5'-cyclic AMP phosphodiesterase CpdA